MLAFPRAEVIVAQLVDAVVYAQLGASFGVCCATTVSKIACEYQPRRAMSFS